MGQLSHPFMNDKELMLNRFHQFYRQEKRHLPIHVRALFPELLLILHNEYKHVIADFNVHDLVKGDQTTNYIRNTQKDFEWISQQIDEANSHSIQALERMLDTEKAALFLASHYYYHSMTTWFWKMYQIAIKNESILLRVQAIDVSFYENKTLESIEALYDECMLIPHSTTSGQRIRHKMAVVYALKNKLDKAEVLIQEAIRLLEHIKCKDEYTCRLSEAHNAIALIRFKQNNMNEAINQLNRAFSIIVNCSDGYSRKREILNILNLNRKRIHVSK